MTRTGATDACKYQDGRKAVRKEGITLTKACLISLSMDSSVRQISVSDFLIASIAPGSLK